MPRPLTRSELLRDEVGTVRKNPGGKLRVALVYPNSYAVGMSNLGFQGIYGLLNDLPDVLCERAFLPEEKGRREIRTLESDTPLWEFDVVAFSISFELDYVNLPRILVHSGIEPFAEKRRRPLVIAGGATVGYNPEPIAPFLDAALVGEAEELVPALAEALQAEDPLEALGKLPGVYLPARGALTTPRLTVRELDRIPIASRLYTPHTEFGHLALIEVGRGCPYGCKFCVASHVYRPARWRSFTALLPQIEEGLRHQQRIGLVGASVTDHPDIVRLCEAILARDGQPSPASMRADALTPELLALLARGGVQTLTMAPEAGTEPLRRTVGKRVTDEALLTAAHRAKAAGIHQVKLYFILGLPDETDDDVAAIPALAQRLTDETGVRVSLGCSVFVPKPGTPFARQPMIEERAAKAKLDRIKRALSRHINFTHESPRWALWQGVLARGDRRCAEALVRLVDQPDTPAAWEAAFREVGLDAAALTTRTIPTDEPLPWAHIGRECVAWREVRDAITGNEE
jgi:radical SAM superfamily enzyme YgiQ (UPF0313 family)